MHSLPLELQNRLKLTDDQARKVAQILSGAEDPGEPGPIPMQGGPGGWMPGMRDRMKKSDGKIEALLTPAQNAEFEKFRKERNDWMRPHDPGMDEPH
jgi:hypothetical protein